MSLSPNPLHHLNLHRSPKALPLTPPRSNQFSPQAKLRYAQWELFDSVLLEVVRRFGGPDKFPKDFLSAMQDELAKAVGWDGLAVTMTVHGQPIVQSITKSPPTMPVPHNSPVVSAVKELPAVQVKVKMQCMATNKDGTRCKRKSGEKTVTGKYCATHYVEWDAKHPNILCVSESSAESVKSGKSGKKASVEPSRA
jgi:hypothetical protein